MTLHRSRGRLRPAPARPDELPEGVAAPAPDRAGPVRRDKQGRFVGSAAAKAIGARGGHAKAQRSVKRWTKALRVPGPLAELAEDALMRPFVDEAEKWFVAKCQELADTAGGGVCGAGAAAIVRSAAYKFALSQFYFAANTRGAIGWDRSDPKMPRLRTDVAALAARLSDSARQDLIGAHELAAREAAARRSRPAGGLSILERLAIAMPSPDGPDEEEDEETEEHAEGEPTDG